MASATPSPSGCGSVMWCASQLYEPPNTSANGVAPRAKACSSDSNTKTPAPSPITNPSRSLSHGLEALVGSSLRLDMALTEQNPPMPLGRMAASLAPASIRSASPLRMWSTELRMQKFPEAHALEIE